VIYRLPPLNALRVFEAAARHLSFKEAANELHITQAAVSHQVKSLEEYLGVELFRRAGRGEETDLEITSPPVFAARWLMPRLVEFSKRHPKIDVHVTASSRMVDAGALDAHVLTSHLDLRDDSSGVEIHLGGGD